MWMTYGNGTWSRIPWFIEIENLKNSAIFHHRDDRVYVICIYSILQLYTIIRCLVMYTVQRGTYMYLHRLTYEVSIYLRFIFESFHNENDQMISFILGGLFFLFQLETCMQIEMICSVFVCNYTSECDMILLCQLCKCYSRFDQITKSFQVSGALEGLGGLWPLSYRLIS